MKNKEEHSSNDNPEHEVESKQFQTSTMKKPRIIHQTQIKYMQ